MRRAQARYFECDTELEATAVEAEIWTQLKIVAAAQGYLVIGDTIVPKRNGVSDLSAQRTVQWDIPTEDADTPGKFLVKHPEKLPGLARTKQGGGTYLADVVRNVTRPIVSGRNRLPPSVAQLAAAKAKGRR